MSPSDLPESDLPAETTDGVLESTTEEGEKKRLGLDVKIDQRGACERHITVTVPREDIDRYFDEQFSELVTSAHVPGFRQGHAPRKLIEAKFRKDVGDQVKSKLLMDSIAQISDEQELAAISEPDFKIESVVLPKDGPMVFEFDLEVRPEFDLPQWKGLKIEKPVREFSDKDVDVAMQNLLSRYGSLVPFDGPAESGDYITTNLSFSFAGKQLSSSKEEVIRLRPVLSFRDGKIPAFDQLMAGVKAGETREGEAELSQDAPNQALRGAKVTARFEVLEVKKLKMPELTPQFLDDVGGFQVVAELRDAVLDNLKYRHEYQQRRVAREQITKALLAGAEWELPPGLLQRQSQRELTRMVMELQRSGFGEKEIRAYENDLRQNSRAATARALKEHFIFERIAELEEIQDEPDDYDREIELIAEQTGETPRRVRARLEKGGGMDVLRNQVIERKVVDRILESAEFVEVPFEPEAPEAEAVDWAAGGGEPESDIPEVQPENSAKTEPESGSEQPSS